MKTDEERVETNGKPMEINRKPVEADGNQWWNSMESKCSRVAAGSLPVYLKFMQ